MSELYPEDSKNFVIEQSQLMQDSFLQITGNSLLDENLDAFALAENLFYAPFALVSHDSADDPIFNYANQTALKLFEFSWEEFISIPSRLSAESINQAERTRLLAEVASKGFIRDYRGVRISKTGKRFWIRKAIVWNLFESTGQYKGQAACFRDWGFIK